MFEGPRSEKPKIVRREGENEHGYYEVEYVPDHEVTADQLREKLREIAEKEKEKEEGELEPAE